MVFVRRLKWRVQYHSVMFFVFQIFTLIVFLLGQVNSRVVRDKTKTKDFFISTSTQKNWKIEDDAPKNITSFKTHIPLFQIIKNLTKSKTQNLKSNVFDKMLSDEMLSLKQHFYKQDKKMSTVSMTSQSNVPTPTLDIKQRWPIIETLQYVKNEKQSKHNDTFNDSKKDNEKDKKVLELRSLPEITPHSAHPIYLYHGSKMCTCKNNDVTCETHAEGHEGHTICTEASKESDHGKREGSDLCNHNHESVHSCSRSCSYLCTQKQCTHNECTRDQTTMYSTAFYVSYQPFFIGMTQPPNVMYYHPDVVNEMKFTKKVKHRKTTTSPKTENLYYNENESGESSEEEFVDEEKNPKKKLQNLFDKEPEEKNEDAGISAHDVLAHVKNKHDFVQDKIVSDIVNDLKKFYRDSVIRDCFCSFMTSSSTLISYRIYIIFLSILIIAL